jgi:hypothetical protein
VATILDLVVEEGVFVHDPSPRSPHAELFEDARSSAAQGRKLQRLRGQRSSDHGGSPAWSQEVDLALELARRHGVNG